MNEKDLKHERMRLENERRCAELERRINAQDYQRKIYLRTQAEAIARKHDERVAKRTRVKLFRKLCAFAVIPAWIWTLNNAACYDPLTDSFATVVIKCAIGCVGTFALLWASELFSDLKGGAEE